MKIILMMAITADGKIAKSSDHFPDWTSKEDKKLFAEVTKRHGVVIMGDKTFFTLAPKRSSKTGNVWYGAPPSGSAFPNPLPGRFLVVFTLLKNPPETKNVMWVGGDPRKVLKKLKKMGHKSAILGGGAYLNTQFLKKKLIDEIWLTIEPKIFGDGLGVFGGDFEVDLKLTGVKKLNNNSILVRYKVLY